MNKSKLLYLAPQNPYPPIDGGKIGIYYPAVYLARYFDVTLVFPTFESKEKLKYTEEHFRKYGIEALPFRKNTTNDVIPLMFNFFKKEPFKWDKYYDKEAQTMINSIVQKRDIKYILVSAPHMAKYALQAKEKFKDLRLFLREHNVEYKLVEQFKLFTKNPIFKFIAYWQLKKSKKMEIKYWRNFEKVIFISDSDLQIASEEYSNSKDKFMVLYDGFEQILKEVNKEDIPKNPNFIYTANLKTIQNRISFEWLINKIWIPNFDFIRKNNIKLFVTGNNDEEILKSIRTKNFQDLNIINLGFVDNVNDEIFKYKYVLSPTIIGSGLRLKILNGMACGKTVFTTPLDLQTCNVFKDMENIVRFETPEDFIQKFLILEKNDDLYIKICSNALKTIKKYFSWDKYAEIMFNLISVEN